MDKMNEEYEQMLRERKRQHQEKKKQSGNITPNVYISSFKKFINRVVTFFVTIYNIICIFFKTLFGISRPPDTPTNGYGGNNNNFPPKGGFSDLNSVKKMDLKNLSSCLGGS